MTRILAILLLLSSSPLIAAEKPLASDALKKYQACDHASDCVRVTNGCCDCANGGDTAAIHRKHEKKFRDLFPCKLSVCTQRAGDCMFAIPACENGLCVLVPPKKDPLKGH